MKENIITGRITSTPERSAEIQPASDHLSACSYLLPLPSALAACLTDNRPVPGKPMVGATHDRPRHIRDCRANKNVEAERRRVVKNVRNKARAGS
jgi:hypothetical protein